MGQDVVCPRCKKVYSVWNTERFTCPGCGLDIVVKANGSNRQKGPAKVASRSDVHRKTQSNLMNLFLILVAAGFILRFYLGTISLLLVVPMAAFLIWRVLKQNPKTGAIRSVGLLILTFVLGTILADIIVPPSARCNDGVESHSDNGSGTCS